MEEGRDLMASPIPKGRMIRRSISQSKGFASLSTQAQVLFCMLIPHFNSRGKLNGDPSFIKGECCPRIDHLTVPKIHQRLAEISEKTNVKWFKHDGLHYLHALNWFEGHQDRERMEKNGNLGPDVLPDYPGTSPELVPDYPDTTTEELNRVNKSPPLVPPKDKEEVKAKIKIKTEAKEDFVPPSSEEITAYAKSINYNLNGEKFINYYESKGWKVGKSRMVSWKAAVRLWRQKDKDGFDNASKVLQISNRIKST